MLTSRQGRGNIACLMAATSAAGSRHRHGRRLAEGRTNGVGEGSTVVLGEGSSQVLRYDGPVRKEAKDVEIVCRTVCGRIADQNTLQCRRCLLQLPVSLQKQAAMEHNHDENASWWRAEGMHPASSAEVHV